jgi:hypothetical protein
MNLIHVLLGITVISTGLFTGLLMTVLFLFEKALRDLSGSEFTLVMLRENPGSPSFLLIAAGLLACWCGPVLTSRFVAQPVYGVFMSFIVFGSALKAFSRAAPPHTLLPHGWTNEKAGVR